MNAPALLSPTLPRAQPRWQLSRLRGRLRWQVLAAQLVHVTQALVAQAWRVGAATLALMALGAAGATTWLPAPVRLAVLAGLVIWWAVALVRLSCALQLSARAAVARLEQHNRLPRGTLDALADAPAQADATGLWQQAQRRLGTLATPQLRWVPLVLESPRRWQQFGVLAATVVALASLALAGRDASTRLGAMFSPWAVPLDGITVSALISMPAYMNQSPRQVTLVLGGRVTVSAPAGSLITVNVSGVSGDVRLLAPGQLHSTQASNGLATLRAALVPGRAAVRLGPLRPLARFDVVLTPDGTPAVRFEGTPTITRNQALAIRYAGDDDYGLRQLFLVVQGGGTATATALPAPAPGSNVRGSAFTDLTASRFAGLRVTLKLVGYDAQRHAGVSAPVSITLPEKRFTHPAARQIIAIRKQLWRAPAALVDHAAALDVLSRRTDGLDGNLTAFAGLRSAVWRLRSPLGWTEIESTADLLWQVALDLEAARTGRDLAELRAKFDALMARLQDGTAEQKDIDALMTEMARTMAAQTASPPPGASQSMSADVLKQLMDEVRERMAAGDTQGARKALEALQALMENARFAPANQPSANQASGGQGSGDSPAARALSAAMQAQQDLMTQTRAAGSGPSGSAPSDDYDAIGKAQAGLGQQVARAAASGGPLAPGLKAAAQAMRAASDALARGDAAAAARAQAQALAELATARAQERARAQKPGTAGARPPGSDPLGRSDGPNGGTNGPELPLPSVAERQQVQAIRQLLRDRAADPNRPAAERAYILRLLQQF